MLPIYQYEARLHDPPEEDEEENVPEHDMEHDQELLSSDAVTFASLPAISRAIFSGDPKHEFIGCHATFLLLILAPHRKSSIEAIFTLGIVAKCIELLKCSNTNKETRVKVAELFAEITYHSSSKTLNRLVKLGAVEALVEGLDVTTTMSDNYDLANLVVLGLGRIAGDGHLNRDLVFRTPYAVQRLVHLGLSPKTPENLLGQIAEIFANFCRGGNKHPTPIQMPLDTVRQILPVLARCIKYRSWWTSRHACWALVHLTRWTREAIPEVLNFDGLASELISQIRPYWNIPCLRTIGNIIARGNEEEVEQMLNAGPIINNLALTMESLDTRFAACAAWVTSKIASGTPDHLRQVIDGGLVPMLIRVSRSHNEEARNEAVHAITTIVNSCTQDRLEYLMSQNGIIPAICSAFKFKCNEGCCNDKVLVALHVLSRILLHAHASAEDDGDKIRKCREEVVACGGLTSLEQLQVDHDKHVQKRDNNDIYKVACGIVDNFFGQDDDDVKPAKVQKLD